MTTEDLKSMTVEEMSLDDLLSNFGPFKTIDELARRLEEAQQENTQLNELMCAWTDAFPGLSPIEAQQKIVALQGAARHAMYFIRIHHWNEGYPGNGYWDLDAAGTAYEFLKEGGFDALSAHDAELTAKAKAEALEEAADKCKRLVMRSREVTHKDCVNMLDSEAAEYLAKAKGE